MSNIKDYEPVITILTYPIQQIRIKDIQGVSAGLSSDAQVATTSPELPPAYAVEIIGEKKTCTFLTQSIEDRDKSIAKLKWYVEARESVDITPDPVVNRVK